jgi:hypothetical protein
MQQAYVNAYETWTLYDTVVIASNADTLFKNAAFYTSFAQMSQDSVVPFFNVRNKSVGIQYCNLDSANKLPFVFHAESIGIDFEPPTATTPGGTTTERGDFSNLFFGAELAKHCGFILRISQDEKLVQTCMLMPSGQGVAGFSVGHNQVGADTVSQIANVGIGLPDRKNRWPFAETLAMPREVTFDGQLILSQYARDTLAKMYGPGVWRNDPAVSTSWYPQAAQIRVSLYGKREVQQRNELHYR